MTTASVTVRVDEATKQAAASIAEDFGFDLSSVTRAFYRQIVREQRIPLNLEYPKPNKESLEALKETEELVASGHPGYDSLDDMFKSMERQMLRPNYTPRFKKDVKRLEKKHVDLNPLKEVMQLILDDTPKAKTELKRRHNMHVLKGDWHGSLECHVANAGDWLLIWATSKDQAYFQRTGTHDELFAQLHRFLNAYLDDIEVVVLNLALDRPASLILNYCK